MCRILPKFLLLLLLFPLRLLAQPLVVLEPKNDNLNLRPYCTITEGQQHTPRELLDNPKLFVPISSFKYKKPDDVFWLRTTLIVKQPTHGIISFRHLTDAELFLRADTPNAAIIARKAGAFRPIKDIVVNDSRFHFSIELAPNITYTLLIKSTHTKKYKPIFDFELSNRDSFMAKQHQSELLDLWLQGASALLILYVFLSWLSTRYRPFIWLILFALGFHFYNISQNRYFIDWFFPTTPQTGWLFVQSFLHLGLLGLFLLLIDSWKIKEKSIKLYRYGQMVIAIIILIAVVSFIINFFFSNYKLSTQINIVFSLVFLAYAISTPILLWRQLDKQERYLAYGLGLYVTATIFFNITISLWGEQLYLVTPIATKIISICVVLLFLMGLNARLRQNEKDKMRYLNELNLLQKHQNEILEESVALRTAELEQRNQRIETLMNELNHRVKNNLQLLYSLNSLQLPNASDMATSHLIKDNISRIKAMMLVNEGLNPNQTTEEKNISLFDFITEIITHSRKMFELERTAEFKIEIEKQLMLDSRIGLSLGIIISELITNSYKHAFVSQPQPHITIGISLLGTNWRMKYADNGKGMPANNSHSLGLSLINDLIRQLKGTVETINDNGLVYVFNFPATS